MRGPGALGPGARALLAAAGPLSPESEGDLRREMADLHCGEVPDAVVGRFVGMQRARDATLAAHLLAAAGPGGGVLITGAGHARKDRGVPAYLAHAQSARSVLSVGLVEVNAGAREPQDYQLPFDLVVFTPRALREDPCAELRRRRAG